jgi:hypothetical protein
VEKKEIEQPEDTFMDEIRRNGISIVEYTPCPDCGEMVLMVSKATKHCPNGYPQ